MKLAIICAVFIFTTSTNDTHCVMQDFLTGKWCSSFSDNKWFLSRQPPIMQCTGIEFKPDNTSFEYLAPNIFGIWEKRKIYYKVIDSTIQFTVQYQNKKGEFECYKILSLKNDQIILQLMSCQKQ
jgi:hypothetical protein